MRKIPKLAYFYWGAPILPYLRYMGLYSFKKFNPDWKVTLFTPAELNTEITWQTHENEEPLDTEDYTDRLGDIDIGVQKFDMGTIGYTNAMPEVVKSDILRLYLLKTTGGFWSDLDILYFRSIEHTLKPTDCQAYFCYRRGGVTQDDTPKNGPLYHSIGFLMGEPGCTQFDQLFNNARSVMDTGAYQSVGSPYYRVMIDMQNPAIFNIDINMVYPSRAPQSMFESPTAHHIYEIRNLTIGWHWYAGHPTAGRYQNLMTESTYKNFDNIISHVLGRIYGS